MIRRCHDSDFETILTIINSAAAAYDGVIPQDRWNEPYMSRQELLEEMGLGVKFWGYEDGEELVGVMGVQPVQDVTLIRHAYVHPDKQRKGLGGKLLSVICQQITRPLMVGTWADASWAIRFYEKHGFRLVSSTEKDRLLRTYWTIPERQIETSVVLVLRSR